MPEHTYRDTTWRAELMGSEGWAVFVGPRMLANCLWEHQARFIVTACNCHGKLLEALAEHSLYYLDPAGNELFDQPLNWEAKLLHEIRKAEEQS